LRKDVEDAPLGFNNFRDWEADWADLKSSFES
jgi:hypothetical protein